MAAAAPVLTGRSPWHSGNHSQYFISSTEPGLREQLCTRCKRIIKSVFFSFCKFPPLPPKAQVTVSPKVQKQLGEYHPLLSKALYSVNWTCPSGCVPAGFLGLGEWQIYCRALETFLQQIATHGILSKNKALEIFLTHSDVSGRKRSSLFFMKIVKKRDIMRDILVKLWHLQLSHRRWEHVTPHACPL